MKEEFKIDNLLREQELLKSGFLSRSLDADVPINIIELTNKELYFSRTIFDAMRENRRINITLTEENEGASGYIKDTGLNYEIKLLIINVESVERYFEGLWQAYKMWMVDMLDELIVDN